MPRKGKFGAKKEKKPPPAIANSSSAARSKVWQPGVDPIRQDEQLSYDPTAYDCLHTFGLDWPCLSFDFIRDDLGAPRSAFPHTLYMVAGTQAVPGKQNVLAVLKLDRLSQQGHGKKAAEGGEDSDDDMEDDDSDKEEGGGSRPGWEPPKFHFRNVAHKPGVNRVRCMPQQGTIVASWGDTGQVMIWNVQRQVQEMDGEKEPKPISKNKMVQLKPMMAFAHGMEGYAMDWSPCKMGLLVTGDCRKSMHVWQPKEGGAWEVGAAMKGHEGSVEDLQWSPSEETVLASASADQSVRIWDIRDRSKAQLVIQAHDTDVNVISWNRITAFMLASGAEDGSIRIWDFRNPSEHVASFKYHRGPVNAVQWCPQESSVLATCSADNQLAIWDLALERDTEEEAALASGAAVAPDEVPPQLLFIHSGQQTMKECHWHPQIPGLLVSTAADGFNAFKPSNVFETSEGAANPKPAATTPAPTEDGMEL